MGRLRLQPREFVKSRVVVASPGVDYAGGVTLYGEGTIFEYLRDIGLDIDSDYDLPAGVWVIELRIDDIVKRIDEGYTYRAVVTYGERRRVTPDEIARLRMGKVPWDAMAYERAPE